MTSEVELDSTPKTQRGVGFWLAFGAVAITNLAAALDATTLSVALPAISTDIGGKSVEAFWAGTSYPLAQSALMLLWVSLSQCFGRRPILLLTTVIFGLGAVLAAVAHGYPLLLTGRTVQGVGGGGIVGLTTVIITDLVPLHERGQFYALVSSIWALGSTTGPIVGGALANAHAWRWIFWLNLPIVGIALLGISVFLKLNMRRRPLKEKLRELDYLGTTLFIASITSFLMAVTWGGTQYPWESWQTLVPLLLGVAGMIAFCVWEVFTSGPTLIPMSIFLNSSATILYLGSFFHGIILWALVYYMPEYFQSVKEYSAIMAGVAALPQTLTVVPCAVGVGIIVGKTGRYRWAIWLGWGLTTLGMGLLIYLKVETSVPAWIFLEMVSGLGVGLLFPSIALAVQASTPPEEAAMASTLVLWFRGFGQTLGVAIGGTIFQNRMKAELGNVPGFQGNTGAAANDVVRLIEKMKQLSSEDPQLSMLKYAFASSFKIIWAVMCAFAGVVFIASFFIKEYSMRQRHVTEQGYRRDGDTSASEERGSKPQ
ncbi:putative MFS multidrug transporter [Lophiotrema nucula]|uniref:Putative MFS multidrug transporter n=1 Tax=Lophiotrema nucula TaxID=690887 RepID=A0A6A5ZIK2_9PLEO|nr:putative MFS multidrug transporter [Lophiotrema nucula]